MKIDLVFTDTIDEKCIGATCFDARHEFQVKAINNCRRVMGFCTIANETYKFSFSPYFMDGDIFKVSGDRVYESMVRAIVVEYVYIHRAELTKPEYKKKPLPQG